MAAGLRNFTRVSTLPDTIHPPKVRMNPPNRRRHVMQAAAALAASMALPNFLVRNALAQTPRRLTPSQSEGPFYPNQAMQDADADLLRNGSVDYKGGEPAWVGGVVSDLSGKPVSGAVVEIWQCDHEGVYRHSRSSGNAPMAFQGFGKVQVGADGQYRFRTIRPAHYPGRTPHIHVKVKLGSRELLTTQMYVAGEPANARDALLRRLDGEERTLLEAPFKRNSDGWQAQFGIVVAS